MMIINDVITAVYRQKHKGEKSNLYQVSTLKSSRIRTNFPFFLLTNLKYAHSTRFEINDTTLVTVTMLEWAMYHLMHM